MAYGLQVWDDSIPQILKVDTSTRAGRFIKSDSVTPNTNPYFVPVSGMFVGRIDDEEWYVIVTKQTAGSNWASHTIKSNGFDINVGSGALHTYYVFKS